MYPFVAPLDASTIDLGLLGAPFTGYINPRNTRSNHRHDATIEGAHDFSTNDAAVMRPAPAPRAVQLATRFVDSRLRLLDISKWTSIPMDNAFAAGVIDLYLRTDHPILAPFDVDLFLDDLITGNTTYCPRLLVHSLFLWACQPYVLTDPATVSFLPIFIDEAERLWEAETDRESLTFISATLFLTVANNNLGKDRVGFEYLEEALAAARLLGLLDVVEGQVPAFIERGMNDEHNRSATAYVAWGVFNWAATHAAFFHVSALVHIAPPLPIPGDNRSEQATPHSLPSYMGSSFTYMCKFWSIVNEMDAWSGSVGPTMELAEARYKKLLACVDNLPVEMIRSPTCSQEVLIAHMYYHNIIIEIFRPFADWNVHLRLDAFSAVECSPGDVIAASVKQLKHLTYTYRSRFRPEQSSIFYHACMLYLVNSIFDEASPNEAKFYFLLCIRGYQSLASCTAVMGGITQALLSVGICMNAIQAGDAKMLYSQVEQEAERLRILGHRQYLSVFVIDLQSSGANLEDAMLDNLVDQFDGLTTTPAPLTPHVEGETTGLRTEAAGSLTLLSDDEPFNEHFM